MPRRDLIDVMFFYLISKIRKGQTDNSNLQQKMFVIKQWFNKDSPSLLNKAVGWIQFLDFRILCQWNQCRERVADFLYQRAIFCCKSSHIQWPNLQFEFLSHNIVTPQYFWFAPQYHTQINVNSRRRTQKQIKLLVIFHTTGRTV